MVTLIEKVRTEVGGANWTALSRRETRSFERLLEKANGDPPGRFEKEREALQVKAVADELLARIAQPEPRVVHHEPGSSGL